MSGVWDGNWKTRLLERIQLLGFRTLSDYLLTIQAISYVEVANILGKEDVAAYHVEYLQFEEAVQNNTIREAAIDSLVREIAFHLPNGWRETPEGDFDTASVWSDWIIRLENYTVNIRSIAFDVWSCLAASNIPSGWKPGSNHDRLIVQAFDRSWPNSR